MTSELFLAGLDCGLNGASVRNCHFGLFSSREKTTEWEAGKKMGDYWRAFYVQRSLQPRPDDPTQPPKTT